MKAFRVTIKSWSGLVVIMAAPTAGKAKASQWRSSEDAGYEIPFTDFVAHRAPEFDHLAVQEDRVCCLGWRQDEWLQTRHTETYGCLDPKRAAQGASP